jgi:uncharacterized membrane protein
MGENFTAAVPTAVYGASLLMAALGWSVMQTVIVRAQGRDSALARALGADLKSKISPLLYIAGILSAFFHALIADAIYVLVALMWLVPDKRIERMLERL